jgi:RNA polymerase sigma-70 factor (ECF subfamily)
MKPVPMEHSRVAVCDAAGGSANGDALDERDWRDCRQCLQGDEAACMSLFKRHEPRIAKLMWRFTRDRSVQAELVQEVFVQAYLSLHRYRPAKVPFEHWLVRIATRVGYQFWKRQARGRREQSLEGLDFAAAPATGDAEADAAAAAQTLHNLLALLPAKDRLVLTLMYFDECGIREIAQQTGWNSAMVKMRAYRARNRLKQMIEERNLTEALMGFSHGSA